MHLHASLHVRLLRTVESVYRNISNIQSATRNVNCSAEWKGHSEIEEVSETSASAQNPDKASTLEDIRPHTVGRIRLAAYGAAVGRIRQACGGGCV